jgi:hypothetical protein
VADVRDVTVPASPDLQCPHCSARVAAGSAWCGQCYAEAPDPRFVPTGRALVDGSDRPAAGVPDRLPEWTWSRRRRSATTFGLAGRIGWTVAALLPPIAWWKIGGAMLLGSIGVYSLIVFPLVYRDVWARTRIK